MKENPNRVLLSKDSPSDRRIRVLALAPVAWLFNSMSALWD
jgi:hypothetical protein